MAFETSQFKMRKPPLQEKMTIKNRKLFSVITLLFNNLNIKMLKKHLFCYAKEPILQGNSACFALQNRHYYNIKA